MGKVNYILQTNLQHCYNQKGEIIDCQNTGQDAEFKIGLSLENRFASYKEEGVLDKLTNLIFPRKFNFFDFPQTWAEAFSLINQLNKENFLGKNNWRLPNRRELRSIFSPGHKKPALPSPHPFKNTTLGWYWTSTTVASDNNYAWAIHLEGNRMFYGRKDQYYLVCPVAGESKNILSTGQKKSFIDFDDGFYKFGKSMDKRFKKVEDGILDTNTNLIWLEKGYLEENLSWEEAFTCLKEFNSASKYTWRIPNINELESLVNCAYMYPALEKEQGFKDLKNLYLSSTTSYFEPTYAFVLYLDKGAVGVGRKEQPLYSLLPVRTYVQNPI